MKIAQRATAAAALLSLLAACSGGTGRERVTAAATASPTTSSSPGPGASPAPTHSRQWKGAGKLSLEPDAGVADIVATGPRQAWAHAFQDAEFEEDPGFGVVFRWNGSTWSRLPDPPIFGYGSFDATGPDDLWIAGSDTVAHWDGRRWTQQRPFGISKDEVFDDIATDGDTVVLIGTRADGRPFTATGGRGRFRLESGPSQGRFSAVTARSGHAWMVGAAPNEDCTDIGPAVEHSVKEDREGYRRWRTMSLPLAPGGTLTSVAQISPTDVWAVGKVVRSSQTRRSAADSCDEWVAHVMHEEEDLTVVPLVMHWDGRSWQRVAPPPMNATLTGVTAVGPDDVWILGHDLDRPGDALFLHFDGKNWTREYAPNGKMRVVAAIPGSKDVWAVGETGVYGDYAPGGEAVVLRRDGRVRPGRA
ncbi:MULTISPECIES: hypothetical protein [Nonomuraea]|uniref:Uncharacterized protein n=1 Tax=Nonomuraea mangrovi TaxID=2316207 RepID=A0ABW4T989_9ACTN